MVSVSAGRTIEWVVQEVREIEEEAAAKRSKDTKKRQMDRNASAVATATAKRQLTIAESQRAVDKQEVDFALSKFFFATGPPSM